MCAGEDKLAAAAAVSVSKKSQAALDSLQILIRYEYRPLVSSSDEGRILDTSQSLLFQRVPPFSIRSFGTNPSSTSGRPRITTEHQLLAFAYAKIID